MGEGSYGIGTDYRQIELILNAFSRFGITKQKRTHARTHAHTHTETETETDTERERQREKERERET